MRRKNSARQPRATYEFLEQQLKKLQSPARFEHGRSVSKLAGELAEKHGEDAAGARLAGLLHDWAKEWTPQQLVRYALRNNLRIPSMDFIRRASANLLHAYVSAHVAQTKGWLHDPAWIRAIASHTLGAPSMGVPEKILYVADLASYDRRFPEAPGIREEAFANLDKGFSSALAVKLTYQVRKRKPLHPIVADVWNRVVCGFSQ
jgi:predicted HD superfamily hydrolase involved in NAD metabolism